MSAVRLEHVSSRILTDVSLSIADGEAVAVLGPSGAGKSTLLKVIAGLLPYRGQVLFDDRPVDRVPPHRRRIGYLSQDLHLFPHLSVEMNVRLALAFGFDGRGTRAERTTEALSASRAAHLAKRRPATLSGGERQRAALARCLARHPRLLLLDEPFSSLDRDTKQVLWREVDQLRRRMAMTALIVTHDPREAEVLADRVVMVRDGALHPAPPAPVNDKDKKR